MNKVIHGALRRDLTRFDKALSAFGDADTARAQGLGEAWRFFEYELNRHHVGEHDIAWPALKAVGVSDETLQRMDSEHDTIVQALADASAAMTSLAESPSTTAASAAADAVRSLRTAIDEHLEHEEAELEPVYQAKKDTPEIKAMGRAFGRTSPLIAGKFLSWVQHGASQDELAGLRANVPGPALVILGGLFGRPYRRKIAPMWDAP